MSYKYDFNKNGYVVIKNCLSQPEIAEINSHSTRVFELWFKSNKAFIVEHQMVNMHSLTDSQYFVQDNDERIQFFNAISLRHLVKCVEDIF